MENLHLLFYKSMYDNIKIDKTPENDSKEKTSKNLQISISDIVPKNKRLTNSLFYEEDYKELKIYNRTLLLKTTYPGLLVGVGYAHGVSDEDDFKIGFSFDYVTGQPYIPGSSVKGVLRSVFSNHPEVIAQMLSCDESIVPQLMNNIFCENDEKGRDVFFDAVIIRGDENGRVLANDYITPHPSATDTPKPTKMLKVLPNVIFEFRFNLKDTVLSLENGEFTLTADQKTELFKNILCEFGAGAKTNVGYGNLVYVLPNHKPFSYPQTPDNGEIKTEKPIMQNQNSNKSTYGKQNNGSADAKKCPSCGMKNYRYYKDSTAETKSWKKGVCFKCGASLGIK